MERADFEKIRDLAGKVIEGDIRLRPRRETTPVLVASQIEIQNSANVQLLMNISYNPETNAKTVNVVIRGQGPICRLDVDGNNHKDQGRSHKHSLQSEKCPDRNLPDGVVSRKELAGLTIDKVFAIFCKQAKIEHSGQLIVSEPAT